MFCKYCGNEIDDKAVLCPSCKKMVGSIQPEIVDDGGFLWSIVGFLIPILGFILYLVWKDTKPKTAKAMFRGMIACLILIAALLTFEIIMAVSMIFLLQ